jgi:hypothetical protein
MKESLPIQAAEKLINFIDRSNYNVSPQNDGVFASTSEAIEHINSDSYDPEKPLRVVFGIGNGDYTENADVTFDGQTWSVTDQEISGKSGSGDTIESALIAFRNAHAPDSKYYPVELI